MQERFLRGIHNTINTVWPVWTTFTASSNEGQKTRLKARVFLRCWHFHFLVLTITFGSCLLKSHMLQCLEHNLGKKPFHSGFQMPHKWKAWMCMLRWVKINCEGFKCASLKWTDPHYIQSDGADQSRWASMTIFCVSPKSLSGKISLSPWLPFFIRLSNYPNYYP